MAATDPTLRSVPTSDLVRRLINDLQIMIDRQVELAKQEIHEDLKQVVDAAKTLGVGLGLLIVAGLCFFHFLFLAIDTFLPRWGWLAALVLTLVFGIVGALLAQRGRSRVKLDPLARTRETLKEDATWAKHQFNSNGSSSGSGTASPLPSKN